MQKYSLRRSVRKISRGIHSLYDRHQTRTVTRARAHQGYLSTLFQVSHARTRPKVAHNCVMLERMNVRARDNLGICQNCSLVLYCANSFATNKSTSGSNQQLEIELFGPQQSVFQITAVACNKQ